MFFKVLHNLHMMQEMFSLYMFKTQTYNLQTKWWPIRAVLFDGTYEAHEWTNNTPALSSQHNYHWKITTFNIFCTIQFYQSTESIAKEDYFQSVAAFIPYLWEIKDTPYYVIMQHINFTSSLSEYFIYICDFFGYCILWFANCTAGLYFLKSQLNFLK